MHFQFRFKAKNAKSVQQIISFFLCSFPGYTAIHRAIIETVGNLSISHPQACVSQMILLLG
jgi:hypothetical protein